MKGSWRVGLGVAWWAATTAGCIETVSPVSVLAATASEAVCRAECGCNVEACQQWIFATMEEIVETQVRDADAPADLRVDAACVRGRARAVPLLECAAADPGADRHCGSLCPLLVGTDGIGSLCDRGSGWTTCARGLRCRDGRCQDPCGLGAVGNPCGPEADCSGEAVCDFGAAICVAPPGDGEACIGGQCGDGLPCVQGRCQSPQPRGAPCSGHAQCQSLSCPQGFCADPPGAGEACPANVACAAGLRCDDGVCKARSVGDCGSGWVAVDGTCVSADDACGARSVY